MPTFTDRYQQTFTTLKQQNRPAFCPFEVLGHPNKKAFLERIKKYLAAKPDILELGIPFSDPVADGPTIQAADEKALQAGITPPIALQLIAEIRKLTRIPIGILVYSNIVIHYGVEKFYQDLKKAGADSILIADVPLEEAKPFVKAARKNQLHQIFIVSENTTTLRLRQIEKVASGFLYVVSTLGVTGTRTSLDPRIHDLIKKLKKTAKLPLMIGFGISTPAHIQDLKKAKPAGLIVGSALVKTSTTALPKLLTELKNACL